MEFYDSMDVETVSEILNRKFYRQHGLPKIMIPDRNKQFVYILWGEKCKVFGIERKFSTIYHLKFSGATERMNQTVQIFLRIYIDFFQRN